MVYAFGGLAFQELELIDQNADTSHQIPVAGNGALTFERAYSRVNFISQQLFDFVLF